MVKHSPKRVLCVDDNQETCELTEIMLDRAGYAVTTVDSMAAALTVLKRQKFDLIILETRLYDGSGLDLCSQIRSFDCQTSIVFHSADARQIKVRAAVAAGANDYLCKPNGWLRLVETVRGLS